MTYATQADLEERFGSRELIQVTDKDNTGGINDAALALALADADAEIDSRLAVRYGVPLSAPVPARITAVACAIARYRLHEDRASQRIRDDYDDAVNWLRDVAAGKADVPGLSEPVTLDGENFGVGSVRAPTEVFTQDTLDTMP